MNALERFFIITDALFPAKTPRSELQKLYENIDFFVSDRSDALIVNVSAEDTIPFLKTNSAQQSMPRIIVAPVTFALRYENRPQYAALTTFLGEKGYSLFNLYNVTWKRGQIQTAYALYIDEKLRSDFIERIRV